MRLTFDFEELQEDIDLQLAEIQMKMNLQMQEFLFVKDANGKSIYDMWLEQGNEGSEQDFLDSLKGDSGENGKDGVSATHRWNGTILYITSASGTSSADLKGEKGDTGEKGDKGDAGPQGLRGEKGEQGEQGHGITCTVVGDALTIEDSSNGSLKGLRVFGRTDQEKTTGKNLFNPENIVHTYFFYGDTALKSAQNAITVYAECEPNTTYTISKTVGTRFVVGYTVEKPANTVAVSGVIQNYTASAITITTGSDAVYLVAFVYNSSTDTTITQEDMLASVQVEKGSTATKYEPYTGVDEYPNLDYPQKFVDAGKSGNINVEIMGSNLGVEVSIGRFGVLIGETLDDEIAYASNRATTPRVANRDYYITSSDLYYQVYVVTGDDTISQSNGWFDLPYHHVANSNKNVRFMFRKSNDVDISLDNPIMISLVDSEYEENWTQSLTISAPNGLKGIKVSDANLKNYTDADGNMWCCDEIDFERGVYVKRIGESILNNVAYITTEITSQNRIYYQSNNIYNVGNSRHTCLLCDKLRVDTTGNVYTRFQYANAIYMYCGFSTYEECTEYFANNQIKIRYILAEPVETPLTDEEMAKYKALHTNYPITTILNDADTYVEVEYQADTKNYISVEHAKMEAAFDAKLSAIISLLPEAVQAAMIENETMKLLIESEE